MSEQKPTQDIVAAPVSDCPSCKRPSECPSCHEQLGPQKSKDKTTNTVNIDADVKDTFNQLPPKPDPLPGKNSKYHHCMPPEDPIYQEFSVFLAGSIEMGNAIQWQKQMAEHLQDLPISIYNPRRGTWDTDANAGPGAKNLAFRRQVEWELDALQKAKVICFFFDHETMSPVTMCELGLWAHSGKVVVCCNSKFWKSGNVQIVCERYKIPCVQTFAELEVLVRAMLYHKGLPGGNKAEAEETLKKNVSPAPELKNA